MSASLAANWLDSCRPHWRPFGWPHLTHSTVHALYIERIREVLFVPVLTIGCVLQGLPRGVLYNIIVDNINSNNNNVFFKPE